MKKEKGNRKKRNIFLLVLEGVFFLLFLVAAVQLGKMAYDYYQGDKLYDKATEEYLRSDSSKQEGPGITVDFAALKEVNPEIIGWIVIPDTAVNYPLLQTTDNNYYLKHTYDRTYSDFGSIFLASECTFDFSDLHTLIYGHNTKNGSMFGSLKKYKDKAYLEAHPNIYIVQENRILEYKIISAFTAETSDDVYLLSFATEGDYYYWLQKITALSEVESGTEELPVDSKVITLSTCTSRTQTERFTVNAVLSQVYSTAQTTQ